MSEETKGNVLAGIDAMEAAAFRTGLMARRLLAGHPDLPVKEIRPGFVSGGHAELQINTDDCDGVRLWAERFGLSVESDISSYTLGNDHENVYEACRAKGQVDGVGIELLGTRSLDGAEREAWLAERDKDAAAPAPTALGDAA
ncbi:hypothetical protein FHS35_009139 [Streptomyces umbrinus]|uniref:hypothetical protein n=2 Tax=Streptomyces umbrinus TaxID=67370 RepID=UPI00214D77D6|nr:hypothetical protein [Streptomyces umbrinus]MCR3732221.1 hypothetical protein [Streptomyces umbrinus]